jgi:hypothetical protein
MNAGWVRLSLRLPAKGPWLQAESKGSGSEGGRAVVELKVWTKKDRLRVVDQFVL